MASDLVTSRDGPRAKYQEISETKKDWVVADQLQGPSEPSGGVGYWTVLEYQVFSALKSEYVRFGTTTHYNSNRCPKNG